MSFECVHRSKSQSPQSSSSTSQFAPRPFPVQEPQRPPTQEDIENEAFQQNKFEAFGLQLKEKHGTIIPVEQERLGVLQAKMDGFWVQRMERAKAQPNLLEILIRNSQATQTTESQAPVQSNTIQAKSDATGDRPDSSVEQRPNKTGMPDALKAGVESVSGYSLDDVRVHYNSPKPAQLQALAYTQGTEIHVASGQEEHLPHEAWHVVQQAQGNVQPTTQKSGIPVNNDQRLEHEADVMGAKAVMKARESIQTQQKNDPPSAVNQVGKLAVVQDDTAVVQGIFPDTYNDNRRTEQGIKKDAVQLDHMVPQETLKKFAKTYKTLSELIAASSWEDSETKKQIVKIREEFAESRGSHEFMSENHLINIPNNIVPGLSGQTQGAGNDFDPQVVKTGSSNNLDRYEETAISKSLRAMDLAINKLNQLISKDMLPINKAEQKKSFDQDTDQFIAQELSKIAIAAKELHLAPEAKYDANVWYAYEGGNVKKRPAEWVRNENQVNIGGTALPAHPAWQLAPPFTFVTGTLKKESNGNLTLIPVTVQVDVEIPAATWTHIYERHYLDTFGGTVEAVDTFWKNDPHTYLTGAAGIALMKTEIELMLKRSFNFSKPYDNLDDEQSSEDVSWSKAAQKLFFQGNATSILTQKQQQDGVQYDVAVELKSIAPQDPDLAYAILPSQL